MRLIDGAEMRIVMKVLLMDLNTRSAAGHYVVFPPETFVIPEEAIQKVVPFAKNPGDNVYNFQYGVREEQINLSEALRLLGVTLYHLACGESEHNRESYLIDGYKRKQLNSGLWPVIRLLLERKETDIGKIEKMIDAIPKKDLVKDIQAPAPIVAAARTLDDTLRWLEEKGMKVLRHDLVANFWDVPMPANVTLRYSEATLNGAVEENKQGEKWVLVYYTGQSLRQMKNKVGTRSDTQPCFSHKSFQWLEETEDSWAKKDLEPGYHLLNFNVRFVGEDWDKQEQQISGLGPGNERAHETIVAEAILSNYKLNGGDRLLYDRFHWGRETFSSKLHVAIGMEQSGLFIGDSGGFKGEDVSYYNLGVVLAKGHNI